MIRIFTIGYYRQLLKARFSKLLCLRTYCSKLFKKKKQEMAVLFISAPLPNETVRKILTSLSCSVIVLSHKDILTLYCGVLLNKLGNWFIKRVFLPVWYMCSQKLS